jgi:hypothetical protein
MYIVATAPWSAARKLPLCMVLVTNQALLVVWIKTQQRGIVQSAAPGSRFSNQVELSGRYQSSFLLACCAIIDALA